MDPQYAPQSKMWRRAQQARSKMAKCDNGFEVVIKVSARFFKFKQVSLKLEWYPGCWTGMNISVISRLSKSHLLFFDFNLYFKEVEHQSFVTRMIFLMIASSDLTQLRNENKRNLAFLIRAWLQGKALLCHRQPQEWKIKRIPVFLCRAIRPAAHIHVLWHAGLSATWSSSKGK